MTIRANAEPGISRGLMAAVVEGEMLPPAETFASAQAAIDAAVAELRAVRILGERRADGSDRRMSDKGREDGLPDRRSASRRTVAFGRRR